MSLARGDLHCDVQAVHIAVHLNGGIRLTVLEQQTLSNLPLLVEHREPSLDRVVVEAVATTLHRARAFGVGDDRAQVLGLGDVPERGAAPLRDEQPPIVDGGVSQLEPHGLRLGCTAGEVFEHLHRGVVVTLLDERVELDEVLVERVGLLRPPLVDDDFGPPLAPLDILNLALDWHGGDAVGGVDAVPHAQVTHVLGHDDVAARDPLHVRAVVEEGVPSLVLHVVEVELALLVSEQHVRAPRVELQPVHLGVVRHRGHVSGARELVLGAQVGDSHRLRVDEVCNFLTDAGSTPAALLHPDREQVLLGVGGPARAQHPVHAVLHHAHLPARVHDAHALGVEIELLRPGPYPRHLGDLLRLEVPDDERIGGVRHEEPLLEHVELREVLPVTGGHAHLASVRQRLDHHGAPARVRKLKLIRVPLPLNAGVVYIHRSAQRTGGKPAPVRFPAERGDRVQVGHVLGTGLDPPAPLLRVGEELERVKRANRHGLTRR
mmetsp:Transcript_8319/g.37937  ORF Transcript_8319/g.37937 Transcript_8319/m.37937 type:complete len:491 (+) Transcript_8319:3059-4531(+)